MCSQYTALTIHEWIVKQPRYQQESVIGALDKDLLRYFWYDLNSLFSVIDKNTVCMGLVDRLILNGAAAQGICLSNRLVMFHYIRNRKSSTSNVTITSSRESHR